MPEQRAKPTTALVTGGNRGLGLATCRRLAQRGARVLLAARDANAANGAARMLAAEGLAVAARTLDVADPASVAALAEALGAEGVSIDLLVNNAGVALDGFDAEVARRTLEVNYFGALRVTEALLPRVADGGAIVMVSSGLGELAGLAPARRDEFLQPGLTRARLGELLRTFIHDVDEGRHLAAGWPSSAYRVSKVGLNALVRVLARELADRRIRVNAVCPGWVRTDMGGAGAERSVDEGAASILAAAELDASGGFFRDGVAIPW